MSTRWPSVAGSDSRDLHQLVLAQQVIHLRLFAAQPDQQIGADVGMLGNARQHTVEHRVGGAAKLQAATAGVRERHHPVHVRKLRKFAGPNRRAMYLLTDAEQFTVEMTAT